MDKITKVLKKLNFKERERVKKILLKIKNNDLENLDIKKLKNKNSIFRVRVGRIRIIFKKDDKISLLTIERRSDIIYNF
ncbi:hypothetical protein A2331_05800 [Candidatus Falkowbacteria bacterium RIFOXYB2_FULL_34_18]|uniref:Plasmid stabilization protein n=1 Tax=Candidatus Falkowbacteria bacterium RIFOXYD2_FULL_34_120 TaxID=1798007 RepID=A0A1F5TLT2_9BACT|nr:MAG: hypothetical protein A2331_05800 [Candidatus Falkowbacteria bacterium RIFOXYB2_FULL_34_18]OGF29159.1 MAG: hypothetical protein A2500_05745 [Candidatus Falkowbacteria bacterium RIFOXYC12_FULL_34_55]OGF36965.1 MAG: hypothetical protein A2466_07125 [Candidatus Falkowbacteria bacterium RIFOXYC2_FULL_34_220]OGF38681.1 MAG: hypothetical protein A2515_01410 [Candidatus Falkowbacteria bacterium RIFOXYD12_FULL_34_57]OGF39915.1 MAG: hypothetical protein A2531_01665 [Candidatus Falkowbacteria bact